LWKASDDGFLCSIEGEEFEEGAGSGPDDLKVFDRPETRSKGLREGGIGDWLSYALTKNTLLAMLKHQELGGERTLAKTWAVVRA
jgi:hypothetical protein